MLAQLGATSGSCGSSSGFQALYILVDLLLQLPKLLQGTFGEHGKVAGSAGQNLIAIGFKDTLHPSHLFNRLVKLFARLHHNFILKTLLMAGKSLSPFLQEKSSFSQLKIYLAGICDSLRSVENLQ